MLNVDSFSFSAILFFFYLFTIHGRLYQADSSITLNLFMLLRTSSLAVFDVFF
jgi:hypothetical protein